MSQLKQAAIGLVLFTISLGLAVSVILSIRGMR